MQKGFSLILLLVYAVSNVKAKKILIRQEKNDFLLWDDSNKAISKQAHNNTMTEIQRLLIL